MSSEHDEPRVARFGGNEEGCERDEMYKVVVMVG